MRLQEIFAVVRDTLLGGDSRALLGLLVVVLVIAYAGGLIVYIVSSRSSRGRLDALLQERASTSTRSGGRWVIRALVPLLFIGGLLVSDAFFSRPATCSSCHREGGYRESLAESPHSEVSCMRCHAPSGAGSIVRREVTYVRWLAVYGVTKTSPEPKPGSVDSGSCLGCHRDVEQGNVVNNGVRVRHSDILEAGGVCGDCHNETAHPGSVKRPSKPTMDRCVTCHDGVQASSECPTCHVRDLAFTPAVKRGYTPRKISDTWDSCYRCHNQKPCLSCHGVTMPHQPGWSPANPIEGGLKHARLGFARRDICWRCHFEKGKPFQPADEACSCHGLKGDLHGGEQWIKEHALEATGERGGANAACYNCHDQELCVECHPASYKGRYAPNPGAPQTPGYTPSPVGPEDIY